MTITSERPAALPQPPPTPLRARPSGSQRYMPALDGLRAFAVTAVIAYHLNITHAGGGYLGVDVFFVLSGFLITGLLVEERARTGRIVLRAFWARRARPGSPALMAQLSHPGTDPSRIYYGTDPRAFELLIGAALAVLVAGRSRPSRAGTPSSRMGRRSLNAAGLIALGAISWACATASPQGWMWRGGLVAIGVLTAVVIASVSRARSGPLGGLLSLPPLRWIGVISYGLYLWHWPVIVLMTRANPGLSGSLLQGAQVGTMLVLATTSYFLVERPIRRARFRGWRAWAAAPAAVGATAAGLVAAT